jgi:Transcriptional regulator PadR-like family
MQNETPHQDLYSGLIRLHILHHASEEEIFGLEMIEELGRHGYKLSPGTMYPILHSWSLSGSYHAAAFLLHHPLRNFCSVETCIHLLTYIEQQTHRQHIRRWLDLYMSKLFHKAINSGVSLLIRKQCSQEPVAGGREGFRFRHNENCTFVI